MWSISGSIRHFSLRRRFSLSKDAPTISKWVEMTKKEFGDQNDIWQADTKSGRYAVINKTGSLLKMDPIGYSPGGAGESAERSFTIPRGKSVQSVRPDYSMQTSPEKISTYVKTGVTTRWELWCR